MEREGKTNREENVGMEPRRRGEVSRMETLPMYSPFGMMRRMADEMDRMFEGFGFPAMGLGSWGGGSPWMGSQGFLPQVEMCEQDGKLMIKADLPGLTKDDVKVEMTDDSLVIEGERKSENEQREQGMYRSERSYGQFHREIRLPEGVKAETANATFKNGVLEVTLEAPQHSQDRRRIQIQGEDSGKQSGKESGKESSKESGRSAA
jgi:HSP20 family protein